MVTVTGTLEGRRFDPWYRNRSTFFTERLPLKTRLKQAAPGNVPGVARPMGSRINDVREDAGKNNTLGYARKPPV
jgi:hypothetical protein